MVWVVVLSLILGMFSMPLTGGTASAATTTPFIFWADPINKTVSRATLSGTNKVSQVIPTVGDNSEVSVVTAGPYVYWSRPYENKIGRMKVDGSEVQPSFISTNFPGVLATHGGYLYWVSGLGTGSIGRARLDGTQVNSSYISGVNQAEHVMGLAVSSQFVFWTDWWNQKIYRYDGGTTTDIISTSGGPGGIAIVGSYIYWIPQYAAATVSRAKLDASDRQDNYFSFAPGETLRGITSYGGHLYFTGGEGSSSRILRTNLDGSNASTLVSGLPYGADTVSVSEPLPIPNRPRVDGYDFLTASKARIRVTAPSNAPKIEYRFRSHSMKSYSSWRTSSSRSLFNVGLNLKRGGWVQVRSVSSQGVRSSATTGLVKAHVAWAKQGRCKVKPKSIRYSGGRATVTSSRKSGSCLTWRQTKKNSSRYYGWKKLRSSRVKTIKLGSKAGTVQLRAGRRSVGVTTYLPK